MLCETCINRNCGVMDESDAVSSCDRYIAPSDKKEGAKP
jgi:hypothetical protein